MSDCQRVAAEMLGVPWEKAHVTWGDTSKHLPWSCVSGGSQTIHAHTRASHAAAIGCDQEAAGDCGKGSRRQARGLRGGERARGPQGRRRGHDAGEGRAARDRARRHLRRPRAAEGHQRRARRRSATALAGQGLMGVAKDNYQRDGATYSFVAGVRRSRSGRRDRRLRPPRLSRRRRRRHGDSPARARRPDSRPVDLGIGHAIGHKWVYDQQLRRGAREAVLSEQAADDSRRADEDAWSAVELPDPETPVGAKRHRRAAGRRRAPARC